MPITRLTRLGNSTAVTLPREVLAAAGLDRGDKVSVEASNGRIEIVKADDEYSRAMAIGRAFNQRYRHAMATLAK